jgi:hypothetical protein
LKPACLNGITHESRPIPIVDDEFAGNKVLFGKKLLFTFVSFEDLSPSKNFNKSS